MTYVSFDVLPDGVERIKHYRSLGVSLVECSHAAPIPLVGDRMFCRICRTVDPSRPVKLLAVVPLTDTQAALF